ncbi:MAG: hypothetical protein AAF296_09985 [Pseudomonadota bacterium]
MFRLFAMFSLLFAASLQAGASVSHTLKFSQGPVILVWQDGQLVGQGEEITLTETAALPVEDTIGGGVLIPVFASPQMQSGNIVERFSVASNTAVRIKFVRPPAGGTVKLRLISKGGAAQFNGPVERQIDFSQSANTELLLIRDKTAARRGEAQEQALEFEIERSGPARDGVIMIEAADYS